MKILVVEDDPRTAEAIENGLRDVGWSADILTSGTAAVERISTAPYDAVIMDIMLPGCDGVAAVRQLRARSNSTPILLLSARGETNQRINGLDAGADDYLPKPFSMGEVVARLRAITRRAGDTGAILMRMADLTLDVPHRCAVRAGRTIDLSAREFRLLEVLMRDAGNVCTRRMLLSMVWDYQFDPGTNLVDVYIRKLRDKVDHGQTTPLLHTVRGVGYVMSEKAPA